MLVIRVLLSQINYMINEQSDIDPFCVCIFYVALDKMHCSFLYGSNNLGRDVSYQYTHKKKFPL